MIIAYLCMDMIGFLLVLTAIINELEVISKLRRADSSDFSHGRSAN